MSEEFSKANIRDRLDDFYYDHPRFSVVLIVTVVGALFSGAVDGVTELVNPDYLPEESVLEAASNGAKTGAAFLVL